MSRLQKYYPELSDTDLVSRALEVWSATIPNQPSADATAGEASPQPLSAADLEQDRSDVWRTLGIAQDATADDAIAAIVALRAASSTPAAAPCADCARLREALDEAVLNFQRLATPTRFTHAGDSAELAWRCEFAENARRAALRAPSTQREE